MFSSENWELVVRLDEAEKGNGRSRQVWVAEMALPSSNLVTEAEQILSTIAAASKQAKVARSWKMSADYDYKFHLSLWSVVGGGDPVLVRQGVMRGPGVAFKSNFEESLSEFLEKVQQISHKDVFSRLRETPREEVKTSSRRQDLPGKTAPDSGETASQIHSEKQQECPRSSETPSLMETSQ